MSLLSQLVDSLPESEGDSNFVLEHKFSIDRQSAVNLALVTLFTTIIIIVIRKVTGVKAT